MKLNYKQKKFVAEYLKEPNATQAAINAGYSKKTSYSQGQRLLKNQKVSSLINEGRRKIEEEIMISAKWACEKYQEIIEETQKSEQFHITLNDLNALVDRLNTFENVLENHSPVYYQPHNATPLRKIIHPGYVVRD